MKKKYIGLLFITPWLLGFVVFTVYPFISSFVLSFTEYNIIDPPRFAGFSNYVNMFTQDPDFWNSMLATFKYVFFTVPLKLAFALFIAFILNFQLKGISLYRTAYYIPSILGGNIAISVLWRFLFSTDGLVNQSVGIFGVEPLPWFSSSFGAMVTISLLRIWEFGSAMLIFLAALKEIPTDLYDAAAVDGAGKAKVFFKVTMPLLTPIIFFNLVMQMIHAFQEFNGPYMITAGGPMKETYLFSMLIYDNSFKYFNMGYASAISWILFVIIMIFTLMVFKSSSYWVFYSDEAGEKANG